MKSTLFQVDAFTTEVFKGNPAAICPLIAWLPDQVMQNIARENNLSETAFYVPVNDNVFHLRWFTPDKEIDLCGHGTLATAFIIFNKTKFQGNTLVFNTLSGDLTVTQKAGILTMDFPLREPMVSAALPELEQILNIACKETWQFGDKVIVEVHSAEALRNLKPDFAALSRYDLGALILTARDTKYDFVSRYLKPRATLKEDPVTGSAHCILAPYWQKKLHKTQFTAYQASPRGGELTCSIKGDRVFLSGNAVLYLEGDIYL